MVVGTWSRVSRVPRTRANERWALFVRHLPAECGNFPVSSVFGCNPFNLLKLPPTRWPLRQHYTLLARPRKTYITHTPRPGACNSWFPAPRPLPPHPTASPVRASAAKSSSSWFPSRRASRAPSISELRSSRWSPMAREVYRFLAGPSARFGERLAPRRPDFLLPSPPVGVGAGVMTSSRGIEGARPGFKWLLVVACLW